MAYWLVQFRIRFAFRLLGDNDGGPAEPLRREPYQESEQPERNHDGEDLVPAGLVREHGCGHEPVVALAIGASSPFEREL